jgi:hypothetical protein
MEKNPLIKNALKKAVTHFQRPRGDREGAAVDRTRSCYNSFPSRLLGMSFSSRISIKEKHGIADV